MVPAASGYYVDRLFMVNSHPISFINFGLKTGSNFEHFPVVVFYVESVKQGEGDQRVSVEPIYYIGNEMKIKFRLN